MKRKQLIVIDPLEDASLLGITSQLKAYKLAWLINQTTPLQLAKVADLCFEPPTLTTRTNSQFLFETEHCTFKLIKNRGTTITGKEETINYLVPRLKHIDYFFAVRDFTKTFDADTFCSTLRATRKITYITILDLEVCKNKAHLFFYR